MKEFQTYVENSANYELTPKKLRNTEPIAKRVLKCKSHLSPKYVYIAFK